MTHPSDHPNPESPYEVGDKVVIAASPVSKPVTGNVVGWDPVTCQTVIQADGGIFMRYDSEISPCDLQASDYVGKTITLTEAVGRSLMDADRSPMFDVLSSAGDLMFLRFAGEGMPFCDEFIGRDGSFIPFEPIFGVECSKVEIGLYEDSDPNSTHIEF